MAEYTDEQKNTFGQIGRRVISLLEPALLKDYGRPLDEQDVGETCWQVFRNYLENEIVAKQGTPSEKKKAKSK